MALYILNGKTFNHAAEVNHDVTILRSLNSEEYFYEVIGIEAELISTTYAILTVNESGTILCTQSTVGVEVSINVIGTSTGQVVVGITSCNTLCLERYNVCTTCINLYCLIHTCGKIGLSGLNSYTTVFSGTKHSSQRIVDLISCSPTIGCTVCKLAIGHEIGTRNSVLGNFCIHIVTRVPCAC